MCIPVERPRRYVSAHCWSGVSWIESTKRTGGGVRTSLNTASASWTNLWSRKRRLYKRTTLTHPHSAKFKGHSMPRKSKSVLAVSQQNLFLMLMGLCLASYVATSGTQRAHGGEDRPEQVIRRYASEEFCAFPSRVLSPTCLIDVSLPLTM